LAIGYIVVAGICFLIAGLFLYKRNDLEGGEIKKDLH
jgi:uncharacterized membrane protein YhiD involved in acid resistance